MRVDSQSALAALLLRPKKQNTGAGFNRFFDWFTYMFGRATDGYVRLCGGLIRKSAVAMVLGAVLSVAAGFFGSRLPSSFLPDEDQGYVYINMDLPYAASLERTSEAARQVEEILANTPGVERTTSIVGFSLLSFVRTTYNGFFFVIEAPEQPRNTSGTVPGNQAALEPAAKQASARNSCASPPAIPGVGTSGGFQFVLEDRAGRNVAFLRTTSISSWQQLASAPKLVISARLLLPSV